MADSGNETLADMVARKLGGFKKNDMKAFAGECRGSRRARGPTANYEDLSVRRRNRRRHLLLRWAGVADFWLYAHRRWCAQIDGSAPASCACQGQPFSTN